ncbi:Root meristem growth factor 6 [Striga hermonthica]|uniref:Root meristem growth factor 6 n=1 Tax=Striga hermonthica TaxID=68872 RepID=A0A9N7RTX4_STRHE|nr:Root meristem growth factor 6 [Striga hermonthica]
MFSRNENFVSSINSPALNAYFVPFTLHIHLTRTRLFIVLLYQILHRILWLMASLVCIVFYLYLHACAARPLTVSDKETVVQNRASNKDVKGLDHGTYFLGRFLADQEGERDKANAYTGNIKVHATGTEVHMRVEVERSALDSSSHKAEENVSSNHNNNTVEDAVAMDYAQPHRKPPIHNRET